MSEKEFSQILEALAEPFPSEYIEWKPQSLSKDGKRAIAATYVDARRYQERLDRVCPGWSSRIELLADGQVAKVALTIQGVTREDVGEAEASEANTVTTAVAQAFKRACAAFGLGRYLYFLPLTWCDYDLDKRRILNPPQLPDWARPSSERRQAASEAARQRVAAEMPVEHLIEELGFSPEQVRVSETDPGATLIPFGRNKDRTLAQVWESGEEGRSWVRWAASNDGKGFQARKPEEVHLQRRARAFLMANAAYAG